ncbi:MAG: type V CRISPR-associated protein Cas12a/Cpf1, partial [Candidatus Moranbacteria bacterium]|nr:type V CRISPR-associated protein Cas12a/Cpf1 [Candidatus Moranbacteria bacterium]
MNEKQKTSIWERFTNQYSLSKTLRFELKPVGQTQKMLEEEKIFEKDETIKKKYEATKPYFDRLHREFVEEALQNVALSDLGGYFETYKKWKADKKKWGKELQNKEKNLRKELVTFFDAKAKDWSKNYQHINIKKKDVNILFEESVFQILKERYGKEEESRIIDEATGEIVSIFDSWKGFTGYFTKFQETRKNFYKDDGNSTAIATRIIDQNLKRFCDNIQVFNSIKERISFSEIAENFEKSEEEIFSVEHYNPCILQKGIDTYNQILGGQTLKNGEKKKGVNELINLKRQKTGERMSFLKLLDKQILSEKELFIDEIESDEKLLELLKNFQNTAETKTEILRSLFGEFLKNQEKYNLSHIYLSKEAFNTVAHKWTRETDLFEESLFEVLKKEKIVSGSKKKDKGYPFPDFIALEHVKNSLERIELSKFWKDRYYKSKENPDGFLLLSTKEKMWSQFLTIFKNEFSSLFKKEIVNQKTGQIEKFGYDISKSEFEELAKDFTVNEKSKVIIKNFADDVLKIYQMVKYFALEKKRAWNTEFELDVFYTNPEDGYLQFYENAYEEIVQPYNKIRNYLTRRPYNEEKWKLNFECSYLLGGWSSEFETYGSLLFEKNGKYYLGVINGKAFAKEKRQKLTEGVTERNKCYKMIYDFQKPDNKNVPRLFIRSKGDNFSPAVKELNLPIETVLDIYDQGLFKTENKNHPAFKESLTKMIDYF